MFGLERRGVAAITVVIILAVSVGAGVGTPVAVDIIDVDPDHPLYALERIGERIRMVGDEDQMKERWGEYVRLVDRGKGLQYEGILDEFLEKLQKVAPGDVPPRQEVVKWMQEHMPGIGEVQLKLCKEMLEKCKEYLPELGVKLEDEIEAVRDYEGLPTIPPEVLAHLQLIRQKVKNIVKEYPALVPPIDPYFHIEDVLSDVNVDVNAEIEISIEKPDLEAKFKEVLEEFNEELTEIEAKLEGAAIEMEVLPGVFKTLQETHGLHAVKRLVEVAKTLKDRAVASFERDKLRRALGLIIAAKMHLKQAEKILEHATEWEEEHREIWIQHFERFEAIKEKLMEDLGKGWGEIIEEYQGKFEEMRQMMEKELAKWEEAPWIKPSEVPGFYRENYEYEYKRLTSEYAEKCGELITGSCAILEEVPIPSIEEIKTRFKNLQGIVFPWEIKATGKLVGNVLQVNFTSEESGSFGDVHYTYSIRGSATGKISEGIVVGSFEVSASSSTSMSAERVELSTESSANASGTVNGTVSDGRVDCDLKGEGSAQIDGEVRYSDVGSVTWNCTLTFEIDGKLFGEVATDGTFEGSVLLSVRGITVTEITPEISVVPRM